MKTVRAIVKNYKEAPEFNGIEVYGVLDNEGDLKLTTEELGRNYLFVGEFDLVPEGKRFRVDVWVEDEEELSTVLQEIKNMGFISESEVHKWN